MAAISSLVFEIFAYDVADNISREIASIKKKYFTIGKSFLSRSSARWRNRSAKWYDRQFTFGASVRAVFHLTICNGLSLSRSDNTTRLLVHSSTYRGVSNCYRPRSALRSAQIFRRRLHVLTARACLFVAQTLQGTEHTDCLRVVPQLCKAPQFQVCHREGDRRRA